MEISRRDFLKLGVPVLATYSTFSGIVACSEPPNPYMVPQNIKLGKELEAWTLKKGTRMVDKFAELKKAAYVLQGKVDPRSYSPFAGIPVKFSSNLNIELASYYLSVESDTECKRKIAIWGRGIDRFEVCFLKKDLANEIQIPPRIMVDSIRLPIAAKEASQLIETMEYCRLYVNLLKEDGAQFSLINPDGIPTTEDEFIATIAYTQHASQSEKYSTTYFEQLIDIGTFIRVGGIAFANWYRDQLTQGLKPEGKDVDIGKQYVDFLWFKKLIEARDGLLVWTAGRPPAISSREFLQLFNEYTGKPKLTQI